MYIVEAIFIFFLSGGAVAFLRKRDAKAKANSEGWVHLRSGAMHWFTLIACFLMLSIMSYIAYLQATTIPDPDCACQNSGSNAIAFWLLITFFGLGTIAIAAQMYVVQRRALRWRGEILAFSGNGCEEQRNINALAGLHHNRAGEIVLTFYDGTVVRIDPYTRGAEQLLRRISRVYHAQWHEYQKTENGILSEIVVDLRIGSKRRVSRHPILISMSFPLCTPQSDGLASEAEIKELGVFTDAIWFAIKTDGRLIQVGQLTAGGLMTFYFYAKNVAASDVVENVIADWPSYDFKITAAPDPDWQTYKKGLLPPQGHKARIIHNLTDQNPHKNRNPLLA